MFERPSLSAGAAPQSVEDTVDLELTATEQFELAKLAEAPLRPWGIAPETADYDSFVCMRSHRIDLIANLAFAAVIAITTAAAAWRSLAGVPPASATAIAASAETALPAHPPLEHPLVQVANPFDAVEVFEFPAGTTAEESRTAIAELLLQRARDRLRQGFGLRRPSNGSQGIVAENAKKIPAVRLND